MEPLQGNLASQYNLQTQTSSKVSGGVKLNSDISTIDASGALCKSCGDIGFVRANPDAEPGEPDFGQVKPCQCRVNHMAETRTDRLTRLAAIPSRLRSWTLESYQPTTHAEREALAASKEFAQGEASFTWLVLSGPAGPGKSGLAAAILNARIEHSEWGALGAWVSCPDFLDRLRAGYADDSYLSVLETYRQAPLLVFDEMGGQYNKTIAGVSWAGEQIYKLLNHRSQWGMATVITTNEVPEEMDERIGDRLLENRSGFVRHIVLDGRSKRSGIEWET